MAAITDLDFPVVPVVITAAIPLSGLYLSFAAVAEDSNSPSEKRILQTRLLLSNTFLHLHFLQTAPKETPKGVSFLFPTYIK